MTTGTSCWRLALSSNSLSTSSSKRIDSKQPGCILGPNIDTPLTTSLILVLVIHTKVIPNAECHTDHRLVRGKFRLHFKPKPRKRGPSPRKSSTWTNFSQLKWKLTLVQAYKQRLPRRHFSSNTLGSIEESHPTDIWRGSGVYHQEEQRLVQREQPRDSGTACEEEIIPPSPPGSAIMFCVEGCLLSHLQDPPAHASRDPKWVVDQSHKENSPIRWLRWLQRLLQSPQGSVWPDSPCPESLAQCG